MKSGVFFKDLFLSAKCALYGGIVILDQISEKIAVVARVFGYEEELSRKNFIK